MDDVFKVYVRLSCTALGISNILVNFTKSMISEGFLVGYDKSFRSVIGYKFSVVITGYD